MKTSGMLELWNIGKMEYCVSFLNDIIPFFQHSISGTELHDLHVLHG